MPLFTFIAVPNTSSRSNGISVTSGSGGSCVAPGTGSWGSADSDRITTAAATPHNDNDNDDDDDYGDDDDEDDDDDDILTD